ncbi:hypothetical protein LEP1GSC061_2873 [Leptospira wolffii serovar Khorat str. Khorat-H2]|nr:hypothetical protein LEP1GSC061_2873 [Leptospira wolffii serovar Khorat str. Khorat-H2]
MLLIPSFTSRKIPSDRIGFSNNYISFSRYLNAKNRLSAY